MSQQIPPAPDSRLAADRVQQEPDIVRRAVQGNDEAIQMVVRSFLPDDEMIHAAAFLGTYGLFMRYRAFLAITDRRVVAIEIRPAGGFLYTDGLLEHINSSGIGQPSKTGMYVTIALITIFTMGIGLLLAPLIVRQWHIKNKSGLFFNVREGQPVNVFVDTATLPKAVWMYRQFSLARDDRLAHLALSAA